MITFSSSHLIASYVNAACCSSSRPHLTLSVLSHLFFFFIRCIVAFHSATRREKRLYLFIPFFLSSFIFYGNVFLLLFTKIWTVVALS